MNESQNQIIGYQRMKSLAYCPDGTRQMVIGFHPFKGSERNPPDQVISLCETLPTEFLPLGLFFWGATKETLVSVRCGNVCQGGYNPIPAQLFETGRGFNELLALAERNEISVPKGCQLFEMEEISPQVMLTLQIQGPFENVAAWGLVYERNRRPYTRIEVEYKEGSRHDGPIEHFHVGRLIEFTLRGERVALEVKSPTEEGACRLLESFSKKGFYG